MRTASLILVAALVALALAAAVPAASAGNLRACTPFNALCAEETTYADPECDQGTYGSGKNRLSVSSVAVEGSRACDRYSGERASVHQLSLAAPAPGGGAAFTWRSETGGEHYRENAIRGSAYAPFVGLRFDWRERETADSSGCEMVLFPDIDWYEPAVSLGCPAGAPPTLRGIAWGGVLP